MALDLVTRLTLDTQQYDKNLQKSKESLESFRKKQSSVGNSTNIFANGLSKSIGGLVGSIGKLVPAFTAASVGFEAFNRHLKMNEYALDSFNKMSEQAQAAVDDLANSIMSLNSLSLSNLVGNFREMLRVQGELYDAKDALGTFRTITRHEFVDYSAKRTEALVNYREAKANGDEAGMAKWAAEYKKWTNELIKLTKEEQKYLGGVIQKEAAKINAVAKTNLSVGQIMKINRNFATYDDILNTEGSVKLVKGSDPFGLGTLKGSIKSILQQFFEGRAIQLNGANRNKEIEMLDKWLKSLGIKETARELYAISNLRGVGEDELLKPFYEAIENKELLDQNIANYEKEQQRALKEESSVAKSTTKAVQKQEKTTNEFQDAIDRFKSTVSALKEQKESGVIGDAAYRESFQSALSNMVKTLMSADVWNKLTDNQKEYVKELSKILKSVNDADKALQEYNSKSKIDYSGKKISETKRSDIMYMKMYDTAYRDKNPKDTYLGRLITFGNDYGNNAVKNEIERQVGERLAERLKSDKNIDFGKLIDKRVAERIEKLGESISPDIQSDIKKDEEMQVHRNLGRALLSHREFKSVIYNFDKDFLKDLLKDYGNEVASSINEYLTETKYQVSKYDISKEVPQYTNTFQTWEDMTKPLFMRSHPGATERDFLEFADAYYKGIVEDLANRQKDLEEREKDIDDELENLSELPNKYTEMVKKYQETGDKTILDSIALLADKISESEKDIAELQAKKQTIADESKTNKNRTLRMKDASINVQNRLEDYKELDARIKKWGELASAAYETANALGTLSNAFAEAGNQSAASALNIIGGLTQMIGIVGEAIGKILGLMTANNVKSASELPFPANLAAIGVAVGASASVASTVMSMSRRKYAQGGIVQGTGSSFSDQIPISVSNGEMILNKGQQRNLFNLLDRGIGGFDGKIEFKNKLVGSDIIGSATTYNKRRNLIL